MSLARQPQHDPRPRPELRVVRSAASADVSAELGASGSPARGILWGVVLSLAGFWLPLGGLVAWLARR